MFPDTLYPGMITCWAGFKAPYNWMPCDGRKLEIKQYPALFKAIGTAYGGDGTKDFALPNFSGRILIGAGQGEGLDEMKLGKTGGADQVTLTIDQLPAHAHKVHVVVEKPASSSSPENNYLGLSRGGDIDYASGGCRLFGSLANNAISTEGSAKPEPISIQQPTIAMYFIICVKA